MKRIRVVRPTLLFVGEGDAEVAFLRVLARIYTSGLRGPHVTIRNAHGKGAQHVVEHAHRLAKHSDADYDRVAALADADTDHAAASRIALAQRVALVAPDPCLEGLVLRTLLVDASGTTRVLKKRFRAHFGADLHADGLLATLMSQATLERARRLDTVLHALLQLFETQELR